MKSYWLKALVLVLICQVVSASEGFTPTPQHLNVYIKNPRQAPYLLKNEIETALRTPGQQRAYLNYAVMHLGLVDLPVRLLDSTPRTLSWLPVLSAVKLEREASAKFIDSSWKNNVLYISIHPNNLAYEDLLQLALSSLERANNGRLPVINGRELKALLEQRDGQAHAIYKRALAHQKATP